MYNHLVPVNGDAYLPFDTIKRTREDGSEFWQARDLVSMMGCSSWQKFEVPLKRAMKSAENQGMSSAFTRLVKRVQAGMGSTEKIDFELTRFANGPLVRSNHAHPTYKGREYFKLTPASNYSHAKVIPEKALDLVDLLIRAQGLGVQMTEEGHRDYLAYKDPTWAQINL